MDVSEPDAMFRGVFHTKGAGKTCHTELHSAHIGKDKEKLTFTYLSK